eukprot:3464407-Rhodomonas_salina.3
MQWIGFDFAASYDARTAQRVADASLLHTPYAMSGTEGHVCTVANLYPGFSIPDTYLQYGISHACANRRVSAVLKVKRASKNHCEIKRKNRSASTDCTRKVLIPIDSGRSGTAGA